MRAKSVKVTASALVAGIATELMSFNFRETAGAADSVIQLYDGADATGLLILSVVVTKGTALSGEFTDHVYLSSNKLYFKTTGGTIEGVVRGV